jgi:hypothetical protein
MSPFTTLTVSSLLAFRQTPTDPKALARLVGDAFFKESTPPKGPSKPGAAPEGFKVYESNVLVLLFSAFTLRYFLTTPFSHYITLENNHVVVSSCHVRYLGTSMHKPVMHWAVKSPIEIQVQFSRVLHLHLQLKF